MVVNGILIHVLMLLENGHLEVLKWARENGCEWNSWTCAYAAQNGHLEVLKWARENGCEWDSMYMCLCCSKWTS